MLPPVVVTFFMMAVCEKCKSFVISTDVKVGQVHSAVLLLKLLFIIESSFRYNFGPSSFVIFCNSLKKKNIQSYNAKNPAVAPAFGAFQLVYFSI